MQNVTAWNWLKCVSYLTLLSSHLDMLCLQPECSFLLNNGQTDKPVEVCNQQQFSRLAEWQRRVPPVAVVCNLCLQGDSAISWEFIPDMIIAVKLQATKNNYDEDWQVKCVHLPVTTMLPEWEGEGIHTIYNCSRSPGQAAQCLLHVSVVWIIEQESAQQWWWSN